MQVKTRQVKPIDMHTDPLWPTVVFQQSAGTDRPLTKPDPCISAYIIYFISSASRAQAYWLEDRGSGRLSGRTLDTSVSRAAKRNRAVALVGIGDF